MYSHWIISYCYAALWFSFSALSPVWILIVFFSKITCSSPQSFLMTDKVKFSFLQITDLTIHKIWVIRSTLYNRENGVIHFGKLSLVLRISPRWQGSTCQWKLLCPTGFSRRFFNRAESEHNQSAYWGNYHRQRSKLFVIKIILEACW